MTETYSLRSGAADREQDRLNRGHGLLHEVTGNLIPPSIALDRNSPLKVVDVATGTGAWLTQLQTILPLTSTFVGFDITDSQFQKAENVSLDVHDMRQPFPEPHLGQYDIVHARLLMYAFKADEWGPVVANLTTLLKPGGYLFWEDTNYTVWVTLPTSLAHARLLECDMRASTTMGRDLNYIGKLGKCYREAGLVDVVESTHASFDLEKWEVPTALMLRLHEQSLTGAVEMGGVEGLRSMEDVERLMAAVRRDVESGTHIGFSLRRFVGRKP